MYSKSLEAQHAVVASEHPLASLAGYEVLRKGGNAFDAAVATSFTLAVTFHPAGGLGGDFFLMAYEAVTGKVHCLNSSGWSFSGLTPDLVEAKAGGQIPRFGALSCVVPGFVAGVWEMHDKFGTTDFRDLLTRSVEYATHGFPAGEAYCRTTTAAYGELSQEAKEVFAPGGKPPVPGEMIRQERLGRVISEIGEGGPDAFYAGWPAERMRETIEGLGVHTLPGDFSEFKPEWVTPLSIDYLGTTVYEVPPNSMGATTLLILKLLSEKALSEAGPLSKKRIETTVEAARSAYGARDALLGDPRFAAIDLDRFMATKGVTHVDESAFNSGDTTAFSIADSEGNLVSGIQSLFQHYGSRVFVPECGIMLNNRGSGFSLAGPNKVEPRKRPLHTLSAMLLERDGRPYLSVGTSGGDYRPLQHALFVTNVVDYSMTPEQSVGHPRFLWGGGRSLLVEQGYEDPGSEAYDVQWLPMPGGTGVCQAVEISGGKRKAVCDLRGDGVPAGF